MTLVHTNVTNGIAVLTLDSPTNRNALSTALISELTVGLQSVVDDDVVRAVVLSHTGPVFCAGADLRETAAGESSPVAAMPELLATIWEARVPVVARVAGAARGGGLGLIAAADIAVCSMDASFAFSEVRLGAIPATISPIVLARVHRRAAAELFLTGHAFDGRRAAEIGLVTVAVAETELDATVNGYVDALRRGAPNALAGAKQLLNRPLRDELESLATLSAQYFASAEAAEGMAAISEKRAPNWVR